MRPPVHRITSSLKDCVSRASASCTQTHGPNGLSRAFPQFEYRGEELPLMHLSLCYACAMRLGYSSVLCYGCPFGANQKLVIHGKK